MPPIASDSCVSWDFVAIFLLPTSKFVSNESWLSCATCDSLQSQQPVRTETFINCGWCGDHDALMCFCVFVVWIFLAKLQIIKNRKFLMWTKFYSTLTNPVEENISLACGPLFLGELFGRSFALRGRENNRVCIPVQSLVVRDAGPLCVCVWLCFSVWSACATPA